MNHIHNFVHLKNKVEKIKVFVEKSHNKLRFITKHGSLHKNDSAMETVATFEFKYHRVWSIFLRQLSFKSNF